MRHVVICWLLFIALTAPPADAHTSIASMLKDAVIDHDLEKIRIDLLKDQRKVDSDDRQRVSGKEATPATATSVPRSAPTP
jgi:hypothetical protein